MRWSPLASRPRPRTHRASRSTRCPPPQPGQQPGQPQPVGPQQGISESHGLGTDLFAIAGPEEKQPAGNRNGMLVLMAVAAAAAVVIAVLIVALFSS
ncbi:hypothetical protein [Nonomuraea salmonea]|uniref:hypothetical protein n=1 Tax=Nonomuraea salmonea TaxID=46181 RepID=UPI002FEA27EC